MLRSILIAATAVAASAVTASATPVPAPGACPDDALAAYLVPDYACRLGGWTFDSFSFSQFAAADADATADASDAADVLVRPFATNVVGGRTHFGFAFTNFASHVTADGTTQPDASALALGGFFFSAHAPAGDPGVSRSRRRSSARRPRRGSCSRARVA